MARLQQECARIETALAQPEVYQEQSKPQLRELLDSQTQLKRRLEAAESAWLERSEQLEQAMGLPAE